jgi:hypothetical protein
LDGARLLGEDLIVQPRSRSLGRRPHRGTDLDLALDREVRLGAESSNVRNGSYWRYSLLAGPFRP